MGVRKIKATMTRWTPPLATPHPLSSPLSKLVSQIRSGVKRKRRRRELDSINNLLLTQLNGSDHKVAPPPKKKTHANTHTLTYNGTDHTYQRDCILVCVT
jgi:hypothetical protein